MSWRAEEKNVEGNVDVKEKDRGYKILKGISINDRGCKNMRIMVLLAVRSRRRLLRCNL